MKSYEIRAGLLSGVACMIFYHPWVYRVCKYRNISLHMILFIDYLEKKPHEISLLTRRSHIIYGTNYFVDI